jgi:positive regulator of sigma E activity
LLADHQINDLIGTAQITIGLIFLGWLAWLAARAVRRTQEMRHALHEKLLDRFASEQFVAFLETPEGRHWMGDILSNRPAPEDLIDLTIRRTLLLFFIGLACLAVPALASFPGDWFFGFSGLFLLAAALGLGLSGWIVARRRRKLRGQADHG